MYHQYCSVIRRLITLIYQRAHLEAEVTAIRRQAEQANRELQRRLQDDDQEVHICVVHVYIHVHVHDTYIFALCLLVCYTHVYCMCAKLMFIHACMFHHTNRQVQ